MNKRVRSINSPNVLSQTSLVQSILKFLPLKEAVLSATICRTWYKASEDGFNFHKDFLHHIRSTGEGGWTIYFPIESGFFPEVRYLDVSGIPEPRRSHLIDICKVIEFDGDKWSQLIQNFTAPSNLSRVEFFTTVPTKKELNELRTYFDFSKIKEVHFGSWKTDFEFSSTPVEHVINSFPSLESVGFTGIDCAIDFKQVRPIHTVSFWRDIPQLEGKVTVLEVVNFLDEDEPSLKLPFDLNTLSKIQGVEKILLAVDYFDAAQEILQENAKLLSNDICDFLNYSKGMRLKIFEIEFEHLPEISCHFSFSSLDGWTVSRTDRKIILNRAVDKSQ